MKCDAWKSCSDQGWQDELRFLIWRFFEQSAFVNNHLLCYWPTIHNSISKICPNFQVISSHSFEVDELLYEHWAKIVWKENISTPIYVECDKMPWCIDQRFAFKNSGISCLSLIFNLNNPRTTVLYAKKSVAGGEVRRVINRFFSDNWYEPIAYGLRWVAESRATRVRWPDSDECWNSAAPWPFCVALSPSVHWHARCYVAALSIIFSFLDFVSGDLALTEL